jgi:quercetin dioxygenase-like cupin family protein
MIGNETELRGIVLESPEVKNAVMRVLISPAEGWDDHVMRVIELDEDGYTPRHSHPWPHINYIIEGKGILHVEGEDTTVEAGSYAIVPPNNLHQFKNDGKGKFRFICIVPEKGHIV